MKAPGRKILLVGQQDAELSFLAEYLRQRDCQCFAATSCKEVAELLTVAPPAPDFALVLSQTILPDGNCDKMLALLAGTNATLFFFHPVFDSCWWIPALDCGRPCWGAPALRPREFSALLDEFLGQRWTRRRRRVIPMSPAPTPADNTTSEPLAGHDAPATVVASKLAG